ncbi:MAG: hypothetical protein WC777_01160 [Candidatus Gracilibacteria bacterium]
MAAQDWAKFIARAYDAAALHFSCVQTKVGANSSGAKTAIIAHHGVADIVGVEPAIVSNKRPCDFGVVTHHAVVPNHGFPHQSVISNDGVFSNVGWPDNGGVVHDACAFFDADRPLDDSGFSDFHGRVDLTAHDFEGKFHEL